MARNKKKKSWPELGTLRKKEGEKPYLVIHPSVKISIGTYNKDTKEYEDFEELDMGDYRTVKCVDPRPGLDGLLDGGHIDEDEHEERLEFLEEKNIRYKLTVPPLDD